MAHRTKPDLTNIGASNPTPKRVTVRIPPDLNQNIQTQADTWEKQWAPTATDLILAAYFNRMKAAKTKR